jgi:hypothetical protein
MARAGAEASKNGVGNGVAADDVGAVAQAADFAMDEKSPDGGRSVIDKLFNFRHATVAAFGTGKRRKRFLDGPAVAAKRTRPFRHHLIFEDAEVRFPQI